MHGDRAWALALLEEQAPGEGGIADQLDRLCRAASIGLRVTGAAITLGWVDETESVAAVSAPAIRQFAELEFGVGEGPARDAMLCGRPVLVPLLDRSGGGAWPGYTTAALEAGLGATFAFPLHVGAARFGVLALFDEEPLRLSRADLAKCLVMTELATGMLLDNSAAAGNGEIHPDLQSALRFRAEIYQAQGMVMVALRIPLTAALARMRAHAFQSGRDLLSVAVDIVEGRLQLTDDRADR